MRLACLLVPAVLALLAGCGMRDNDPAPGGVTVGEARALDDAAAMLDAKRGQPPANSAATPATPSAAATTTLPRAN